MTFTGIKSLNIRQQIWRIANMNIKLSDFDAILFDLDGTIYWGTELIPGANDTIAFFRNNGKKVFFTTNNSTKRREQIYEKLNKMGVDAQYDEVLTSGYVAADYAKRNNMKDIHIFGSADLIHEFKDMGVDVNQEEDAENLLIGYDPGMTYEDLVKAVRVAMNCKTIMACNREKIFAGQGAKPFPGCGAMTAPVEWCSGRTADIIIGKPNTMLVDFLKSAYGIEPSRALVIGDTYESDVAMAKNAGCLSICISPNEYDDTVNVRAIKDIPGLFA